MWWKEKEELQGHLCTAKQDRSLMGGTPISTSRLSELLLLVERASTLLYEEFLVVSESSEDHIQGLMGCVNEMRSTVCDMQEDEYWQHDNVGVS